LLNGREKVVKNYEKPTITTFDEKKIVENTDKIKISAPPPSAWSCVRG
jgi:hypothetical protein